MNEAALQARALDLLAQERRLARDALVVAFGACAGFALGVLVAPNGTWSAVLAAMAAGAAFKLSR